MIDAKTARKSFGTTPGTLLARLRSLRMSYAQYLASDHWANVRRRYAASPLPQQCLACGCPRFVLHHRSYQRLGREELTDLVPLCPSCHDAVHRYERENPVTVKDTHAILRAIFAWSKRETIERFEPYRLPGRPNGFYLTPGNLHR